MTGLASPRALVVTRACGPHVSRLLMSMGYSVEMQDPRSFRSLEDQARAASLLVTDLHGGDAQGGVGLARRLRARNPALPVVLLAGHLDRSDAAQLDEGLPGSPTIQSPPNGRVLAMAIAAAQDPPPTPELAPALRQRRDEKAETRVVALPDTRPHA